MCRNRQDRKTRLLIITKRLPLLNRKNRDFQPIFMFFLCNYAIFWEFYANCTKKSLFECFGKGQVLAIFQYQSLKQTSPFSIFVMKTTAIFFLHLVHSFGCIHITTFLGKSRLSSLNNIIQTRPRVCLIGSGFLLLIDGRQPICF